MKKWSVFAAVTLFCAVYGETAPARITGKVNADFLNMRAGAGLSAPVAGKITSGSEVQIIREVGNWLEIVPPAAVKIYISEARVNPDGVLNGELNMRAAMSTNAPILGVLPKGARVQRVDERRNGWVRIAPPADMKIFVAAFCVDYDKSRFGKDGMPLVENAEKKAEPEKKNTAPAESAVKEPEKAAAVEKMELKGLLTAWKFSTAPDTAFVLLDAPDGKNLGFITADKELGLDKFKDKKITVSGEVVRRTDAGAVVVKAEKITADAEK